MPEVSARLRMLAAAAGWVAAAHLIACQEPGEAGPPGPAAQAEPPPAAAVESVREIGPLEFLPAIRARDGGYSARIGEQSVWVFGDTVLSRPDADGGRWRSSTWCRTSDQDARDGLEGLTEPLDAAGTPGEFLPFTPEEAAHNRAHFRQDLPEEERSRWALWPGPVVPDPARNRSLVFYAKLFCRSGKWSFRAVGHSLAVWRSLDRPPVRPEVRPGGPEPTLLFPEGDVVLGQGAVVVEDTLYAYGCQTVGLTWPCIVARVPLARALEREAWEFFAGEAGWSADWREAVAVMEAAPMLTVHWNAHLGRFLAVYGAPLRDSICIRTAGRPEGPWSEAQVVGAGLPPTVEDAWDYSTLGHPELARQGGRVEYLSYYRETGFLLGEMRLVELVFR